MPLTWLQSPADPLSRSLRRSSTNLPLNTGLSKIVNERIGRLSSMLLLSIHRKLWGWWVGRKGPVGQEGLIQLEALKGPGWEMSRVNKCQEARPTQLDGGQTSGMHHARQQVAGQSQELTCLLYTPGEGGEASSHYPSLPQCQGY